MLNTRQVMRVIAICDPAIDTDKLTVREFGEYASKRSPLPPIKSGSRPSVFNLRHIDAETMSTFVMLGTTQEDRNARAFRAAVVQVDDAYDADGNPGRWESSNTKQPMLPEDMLKFSPAEVQDIGSVAWARSFLPLRCELRCVLPQLLLAHLGHLPFRSVEPNDVNTNKSNPSATTGSTGGAEVSSGAQSGSLTDAHAAA